MNTKDHVKVIRILEQMYKGKRFFVECNPMDIGSIPFVNTNFAVKEISFPEFSTQQPQESAGVFKIKIQEVINRLEDKVEWNTDQYGYLSAMKHVLKWLDETPPQKAEAEPIDNVGWQTEKPDFKEDCILLTATQYKGEWEYKSWLIAKNGSDEGWYWGWYTIDSEEYGDIADLKADLYLIVNIPSTYNNLIF